jgi:hypothetical protein
MCGKANTMGPGSAIGLGLLLGGLLGAATRPAVVYTVWLRGADAEVSQVLLFASAGIGLALGVIAVLTAVPFRRSRGGWIVAAVSGAILAYLVTAATFLPLFWCGLLNIAGIETVGNEAPLYGAAMALAGALSGGGGAFLMGRLGGQQPATTQRFDADLH